LWKQLSFFGFLLGKCSFFFYLNNLKTSVKGSGKRKTAIFEIVTKSMGCLKLAYRSEAEIPIHRDSQKSEPVLRCVWNAGEQSKNRVRWYVSGKNATCIKIGSIIMESNRRYGN